MCKFITIVLVFIAVFTRAQQASDFQLTDSLTYQYFIQGDWDNVITTTEMTTTETTTTEIITTGPIITDRTITTAIIFSKITTTIIASTRINNKNEYNSRCI